MHREDGRPGASAAPLVGTAARLQLALLRGSLRAGPGATARRVGLVLGAVVATGLAAGAFAGLLAARGHGRLSEDLAVLLFNALLVGWVVLPILTFGSDDLLDPARLALLPLTRRQLVTVMGVGALVGIAPVATTIAALGLVPASGGGLRAQVVAVLAAPLLLALCVSTSRMVSAALSGLLRSRRGRDLGVVLAALVGLSLQLVNPLLQLSQRGAGPGADSLRGFAGALRWTPPGVLAAAPRQPAAAAVASLLTVVAIIAVVVALWERSVRRSLERPDRTSSHRRHSTALAPRWVPLPGGRAGAIAAKDLRYLLREPRRLVATLFSTLLPVLTVAFGPVLLASGSPPAGLVFAVCGVGLLCGLAGVNRFGLDGTATWLLLSSATDPRDARRDLLGGDLASAVIFVPVLLLLTAILATLTDGWRYAPAALGVTLALYAVAVALSGLLAVVAAYPVPASQNAFSSGNAGQGCASGALTLVAVLAGAALCLPLLGLLLPALLSDRHALAWGLALLLIGPVYGVALGAVLRAAAARRWSTRAPEVLQLLATARS